MDELLGSVAMLFGEGDGDVGQSVTNAPPEVCCCSRCFCAISWRWRIIAALFLPPNDGPAAGIGIFGIGPFGAGSFGARPFGAGVFGAIVGVTGCTAKSFDASNF